MQTKTCPYCRTVNEGHAIVCVHCGARIGELPPAGGGTSDAPGTSATPPPTPPASDDAGWGAPPPPPEGTAMPPGVAMPSGMETLPLQPKRSNTMLLLAIAAAVVVVGAAVVLFIVRGGSGGLPSELNGHQRAESETATQLEKMFGAFELGGISFDIGVYGEPDPKALMMLIDGLPADVTDVPSDVFFQSFASSFAQQGDLGFDLGEPVQASSDGADFICVDTPAEAFGGGNLGNLGNLGGFGGTQDGAFCVFKGEIVGMIFLFDGTGASGAMVAAQSAYGELG